MPFVRFVVFALLAAGLVAFVLYLATGQLRYRAIGIAIVKWTVIAALGFFAVLIVERLTGSR